MYDGSTDSLICIANPLNFGWAYICRKLSKSAGGIGYFSETDIVHINQHNLIEIDPIIWSKIHKILRINTIACNTIIQNCEEYKLSTDYYVSAFLTYYKLFEVLEDSQILTKFSNNQVWIKELKDKFVKFETAFSTSKKWISPETYHKVKDNVINTIEEIDYIWETI